MFDLEDFGLVFLISEISSNFNRCGFCYYL